MARRTIEKRTGGRRAESREKSPRKKAKTKGRTRTRSERPKKSSEGLIYALVGFGVICFLFILVMWAPIRRKMLISDLGSDNEATQLIAAKELALCGDTAISGLLEVAKNESGQWEESSRLYAMKSLGMMKLRDADNELTSLAMQGKIDTRRLALMAITELVLKGRFGSEIFLENKSEKDDDVRTLAALGLGSYKGKDIVKALAKLVEDKNPKVSVRALKSLVKSAREADCAILLPLLKNENEQTRKDMKFILSRLRSDRLARLIASEYATADKSFRLELLDLIGSMKKQDLTVPYIKRALQNNDIDIRAKGLEVAGRLRLPEIFDKVVECASDSRKEIRLAAIKAIQGIGDPEMVRKVHFLFKDSDAEIRKLAAVTSYICNDLSAAGNYVKLLDDSNAEVRKSVLNIMRNLYRSRAHEFKGDIEKWKAWGVNYAAQQKELDAIGSMGRKAQDLLGSTAKSAKLEAKKLIEEAIKKLDKFAEKPDLVPEFKKRSENGYIRIKEMKKAFKSLQYAVIKMQGAID